MRFFSKAKDGGPGSAVTGYFLIEIKYLFSIVILKFEVESESRNYHSHAFNAWTWFLSGYMTEFNINGSKRKYKQSFLPKLTRRIDTHMVIASRTSWCLTFRGPWSRTWRQVDAGKKQQTILTHGRQIVHESKYLNF